MAFLLLGPSNQASRHSWRVSGPGDAGATIFSQQFYRRIGDQQAAGGSARSDTNQHLVTATDVRCESGGYCYKLSLNQSTAIPCVLGFPAAARKLHPCSAANDSKNFFPEFWNRLPRPDE